MKPIQPVEDQDKLCCLAALTDCPNVTQVAQDTVQHQTHTHTAARLNFDNAGVDERHAATKWDTLFQPSTSQG